MAAALIRRRARLALAVAPLVAVALTLGVAPAQGAIARLQTGPETTTTGNSVSPTLSSSSTAGNLLVAVITTASTNSVSGPSGWVRATGASSSAAGRADIWYYANNPGGISSATFSAGSGSGGAMMGELTEWSGVVLSSPLDAVGTSTCSFTTSCTVTTSTSTTLSNDVGITIFTTANHACSYGAGTGWTHLFSDSSSFDSVADFKLSLSSGATQSNAETDCGTNNSWAGAIATFKTGCTGGSLTLGAPASGSFPAITLDGTNQTVTTTLQLTPDDESGNGASWSGWNITGTSTTFTSSAPVHTLSTSATAVTAAATSAGTPSCALPTNSIGYPVTLPAGSTPPTAVKLYNAAANTGEGSTNLTLTFRLSAPANTYRGTYTSTWTFAIVSGP